MTPKKAAMNVPSKAEALEESNVVPETIEKKEFVRDFKNKKATEIIDLLYQEKQASQEEKKTKDIQCACGYKGELYSDGRCPECGNIGGVDPVQDIPASIYEPYSRTRSATLLQNDIARCMAERWNFMK